MTTVWTSDDLSGLEVSDARRVPHIVKPDRSGLDGDRIYWDMWPIQDHDGRIADCAGREMWMALTAPDRGDPSLRHFEAKIHLLERQGGAWLDLGAALPDFTVSYEREWAGSAISDGEGITLFFTAAGTSAKPMGYQQRLFEAHAQVGPDGVPIDWTIPVPSISRMRSEYQAADAHEGEAGKIKAFRDPAYFRDPADGQEYLVFTASYADAASEFNGAVGIARRNGDEWMLLPPLLHAAGVNNELERAHVVWHEGRYYLFWATQSGTFAPELRHAPNGLYGMVADTLFGDYRPLNGSGLVLANPADEPFQTYSWFVSRELLVSSFVDFWGLEGNPVPVTPAEAKAYFGGVPAPLLQLQIEGDSCGLRETITA